jgi:hypothetical protein
MSAGEFTHKISDDEAQNKDQRDQNDLGHGYFPEIEPQSDNLGVLYQKDDEQNGQYNSSDEFGVFHSPSSLRWALIKVCFKIPSPGFDVRRPKKTDKPYFLLIIEGGTSVKQAEALLIRRRSRPLAM